MSQKNISIFKKKRKKKVKMKNEKDGYNVLMCKRDNSKDLLVIPVFAVFDKMDNISV